MIYGGLKGRKQTQNFTTRRVDAPGYIIDYMNVCTTISEDEGVNIERSNIIRETECAQLIVTPSLDLLLFVLILVLKFNPITNLRS